jgi:flagellin|tara:strand:- start:395 stop:1312 length:918 start_codon:yes stop_codon:yes gene_type:complete
MSLVVNTNIGSLNAQRSLANSSKELATAMERLSSGKKINSASDDAAGFAIAERMTAQVRGLNMATKNANDGLAMLATIENATNDVTDMLQRIRELAVQAGNDTNSLTDRQYLQTEVNSLLKEINRVADQTKYNGLAVLDGSRTGVIQTGTEAGQTTAFNILAIDTDTLGLTTAAYEPGADGAAGTAATVFQATADGVMTLDATVIPMSILSASDAAASLTAISTAIEQVASNRAGYGALSNRLEYTASNLMNVAEFTTQARSRIEDADFAAESARLSKAQVLQQTGTAMLAQANAASQLAIQLIR